METGKEMIFVCGDTHGSLEMRKLNVNNFPQQKDMTKKDYLIVLGDFGLLWKSHPDKEEKYWTEWLNDKSFTTLFVHGNHENMYRLNNLKRVEMFGQKVGKVSDSIFMLLNGYVYNIDNKKIFVFGGASSIDKASRTEWISWWKDEIPDFTTMNFGLDNLFKEKEIDFVLTHTAPRFVIDKYMSDRNISSRFFMDCPVMKYLNEVSHPMKYKSWWFGHWHDDWDSRCGIYHMLYDRIMQIS